MPRKAGKRQSAALAQIVQNGPGLRGTIQRAQQNAGKNGSVVTELKRLSARGNANATTVVGLLKKAGAGGNGG